MQERNSKQEEALFTLLMVYPVSVAVNALLTMVFTFFMRNHLARPAIAAA